MKKTCWRCYHSHPCVLDSKCPVRDDAPLPLWAGGDNPLCWKPWSIKLWFQWWLVSLKVLFMRKW
jgi:hypothetical protein